jgi:hypothetical protein
MPGAGSIEEGEVSDDSPSQEELLRRKALESLKQKRQNTNGNQSRFNTFCFVECVENFLSFFVI